MEFNFIESKEFKNVCLEAESRGICIKEIGWERELYKSTGNGTILSSGEDKTIAGSKRGYVFFEKDGYIEKFYICFDETKPNETIKAIYSELDCFLKGITL